jgi:hypothetical protein
MIPRHRKVVQKPSFSLILSLRGQGVAFRVIVSLYLRTIRDPIIGQGRILSSDRDHLFWRDLGHPWDMPGEEIHLSGLLSGVVGRVLCDLVAEPLVARQQTERDPHIQPELLD